MKQSYFQTSDHSVFVKLSRVVLNWFHQAEGHETESYQAEGHRTESHQAEGHGTESHQAEGHGTLTTR